MRRIWCPDRQMRHTLHEPLYLYRHKEKEGLPGGVEAKSCLPMQEIQEILIWFLGWEDPRPRKMAAHSREYSCLENSKARGAWQAVRSMGSQRVDCKWAQTLKEREAVWRDWLFHGNVKLSKQSLGKQSEIFWTYYYFTFCFVSLAEKQCQNFSGWK